MTDATAKSASHSKRDPRRRVVSREWSEGNQAAVKLSCGHTLFVRLGTRYYTAKTLGCLTCGKEDRG